MTFLVTFDGSPLATAALRRAVDFGAALDEPVVAITVVRAKDKDQARDAGWIGPGDEWDRETVRSAIERQVDAVSTDAETLIRFVDRYAGTGSVARRVLQAASDLDTTVVFIGSDNAGRMVIPVTSVAGSIASYDERWDVHIVRHESPVTVEGLEE